LALAVGGKPPGKGLCAYMATDSKFTNANAHAGK